MKGQLPRAVLLVLCGSTIGVATSSLFRDQRPAYAQAKWSGRLYYLTKGTVQGNAALTACASGYHMASLWEIFDMSLLQYDSSIGVTADDSGLGPPTQAGASIAVGWIRTGYNSSANGNDLNPGHANCQLWTSNASLARGTAVYLPDVWRTIPAGSEPITPWLNRFTGDPPTLPPTCDERLRVWCVQN
jgi:hypothetical protein